MSKTIDVPESSINRIPKTTKNKLRRSSSQHNKPTSILYKITPEEMWNSIKGLQIWGIKGYEVPRKYIDYKKIRWEKARAEILKSHKKEWPPMNWPKDKESDKPIPPKRKNFIDDQIKWAKSFNDPQKSQEIKESLEGRGTFKYPDKKPYPNLKERFLKNENDKKEKMAQLPKIQPWKEAAIEDIQRKILEDKGKMKTQIQKYLEKFTKEKPWWPRADRITVTSEAEYIGENVPFYNNFSKEDQEKGKDDNKLFFPKKEFTLKRNPTWSFPFKKPTNIPTDQMKAREDLIKEKVENLKSSKNIQDKDLLIDVIGSFEKVKKRGRIIFQYKKPFDYANTDQYKSNREQHPSFSPGPTHYWKNKNKEIDVNEKPKIMVEEAEIHGKPGKIYYMNHKRTDFREYKPMRKFVF